jgi:hypothetical protein
VAELEKAYLLVEGGAKIECLYNPQTVSLGGGNSWISHSRPGGSVSRLQYGGASNGWLRLDLVFDTTATGTAVTEHTEKVLKLLEVDESLPGTDPALSNGRPPTVTFHWGNLHSFTAVMSEVQLAFTYFSSTGKPLRAEAQVSLLQYEPGAAWGPQNPTSGTPKPHRVHRVQPGETLDRISARYYGDSTKWRLLANANALEDPLAVRPGVLLTVPRLEGS